jgi:hypothetical protein
VARRVPKVILMAEIVLPPTVRDLIADQASAGPGRGAIGVAFAAGGHEGACLTVPGSGG